MFHVTNVLQSRVDASPLAAVFFFSFFLRLSSCNGVGSRYPFHSVSFTCGGLSSVVFRILPLVEVYTLQSHFLNDSLKGFEV